MNLKITNRGTEPLRIGEFPTAGLRFLNPDVFTSKPDFPDYLLADCVGVDFCFIERCSDEREGGDDIETSGFLIKLGWFVAD